MCLSLYMIDGSMQMTYFYHNNGGLSDCTLPQDYKHYQKNACVGTYYKILLSCKTLVFCSQFVNSLLTDITESMSQGYGVTGPGLDQCQT